MPTQYPHNAHTMPTQCQHNAKTIPTQCTHNANPMPAHCPVSRKDAGCKHRWTERVPWSKNKLCCQRIFLSVGRTHLFNPTFLDASMRLYMRVCLSVRHLVGLSVGLLVGRSVCNAYFFLIGNVWKLTGNQPLKYANVQNVHLQTYKSLSILPVCLSVCPKRVFVSLAENGRKRSEGTFNSLRWIDMVRITSSSSKAFIKVFRYPP